MNATRFDRIARKRVFCLPKKDSKVFSLKVWNRYLAKEDGAVAQLVESVTPGEVAVGLIPVPGACFLLFWLVSVSCDRLRQKSWSPRSVSVWQHVELSDISLGTSLQDSLVAEEAVKKPTNQPILSKKFYFNVLHISDHNTLPCFFFTYGNGNLSLNCRSYRI